MKQPTLKMVRDETHKEVHTNETLLHPLNHGVSSKDRDRYRYKFLRVTRLPSIDRPDSGRIRVQNEATGVQSEHYALLFNVRFE